MLVPFKLNEPLDTHIVFMTKGDRIGRLPNDSLRYGLRYTARILLQNVKYGQLTELKNQMKFTLAAKYFNQVDQVGVLQLLNSKRVQKTFE